jgi:hypothetical protein
MAYTKLFSSIITSTIWLQDDRTRIVWITMLACADKNGEVQASIPGLARIAGVPVEDCRAAIGIFMSPDPDSRTKDDEGRRIEEIDGGWRLLNYQKYREMASKEELRTAEAQRKAAYRARISRNQTTVPEVPDMSQNVADMSLNVPKTRHIAEAEADSDAEADLIQEPSPTPSAPIGQSFATVAEVERRYTHMLLDPEADDSDKAQLRRVLNYVTSDRITGKPLHPRKQIKILDLFQRFPPGVVYIACEAFERERCMTSGKDHRYLLAICEQSATSTYIERVADNQKEPHGNVERPKAGPRHIGTVMAAIREKT